MASTTMIRVGDKSVDGGKALKGSKTCKINGKPVVRVGDPYSGHGDGPHSKPFAAKGSNTVKLDSGTVAHRTGDKLTCGAAAGPGSPNVRAG